ncbi:hypothetical protein DFP72DRAFT_923684 [Ephemerocybe angulata]|uniref:F-box domain-containing protein n=1 Tax=Ephemerocybe angulata TaxID=980116 RepID=A0A8H6LXQ5_9AGAR|nr:hypothetical protein DFP72DRAFT_923684 [Tulosesus angulatus]
MPRRDDFYELLNSNNVPSSSQAASVQQTIDGLSKRISKLQSQLDALEGQRQRHRAILSPVRRMPMEILGEIFALALPDVLYPDDRRMLRHLGLVCKSWRNASLLAHRLWSGLQLSLPPEDGAYGRAVSWLTKSGALPKTLRYDGRGCQCTSEELEPCLLTNPELLRLLTTGPSLDHFGLLCIRTTCFRNWIAAINSAKKSLSGPCPWDTLRSFRLECIYEESQEGDELFLFSHLPFVTSLNIELPSNLVVGVEGDGDPMVTIPVKLLNQLTTFAIEFDWYGTEIFSLLESCKNLETLTITCSSRFHLFDEHEPKLLGLAKSRVVLPKVRKFSIGRSKSSSILKYLAMPALSDLDLDLEYGREVDDKFGATLHDFFRASNASESLQALRISNTEVPAADLRYCLSNLPLLKDLNLDGVEFGDKLFETTGENQDLVVSPNLPSLEHLTMLYLPRTYEYQSELWDFSEAKRYGPCNLTMSYRPPTIASCSPFQIQVLKKAGVLLNFLPSQPEL